MGIVFDVIGLNELEIPYLNVSPERAMQITDNQIQLVKDVYLEDYQIIREFGGRLIKSKLC